MTYNNVDNSDEFLNVAMSSMLSSDAGSEYIKKIDGHRYIDMTSVFISLDDLIKYMEANVENLLSSDAVILGIGKTTKFVNFNVGKDDMIRMKPGVWCLFLEVNLDYPWMKDVLSPISCPLSIEDFFGIDIDKWFSLEKPRLVTEGDYVYLYKFRGLRKLKRDKKVLSKKTSKVSLKGQIDSIS